MKSLISQKIWKILWQQNVYDRLKVIFGSEIES